jgi:hypothetical protein
MAVGAWYEDFSETTDDQVRQLLKDMVKTQYLPPLSPAWFDPSYWSRRGKST